MLTNKGLPNKLHVDTMRIFAFFNHRVLILERQNLSVGISLWANEQFCCL